MWKDNHITLIYFNSVVIIDLRSISLIWMISVIFNCWSLLCQCCLDHSLLLFSFPCVANGVDPWLLDTAMRWKNNVVTVCSIGAAGAEVWWLIALTTSYDFYIVVMKWVFVVDEAHNWRAFVYPKWLQFYPCHANANSDAILCALLNAIIAERCHSRVWLAMVWIVIFHFVIR